MSTHNSSPNTMAALRRQYGCGPIELTGFADALYERHLFFDNVIDAGAGARERYEAFARSVRDVLLQRWVRTEQTYEHANPKPVVRADDAGPPRTGEWIPQIDALPARRPRLATSRMQGSCRCGRA